MPRLKEKTPSYREDMWVESIVPYRRRWTHFPIIETWIPRLTETDKRIRIWTGSIDCMRKNGNCTIITAFTNKAKVGEVIEVIEHTDDDFDETMTYLELVDKHAEIVRRVAQGRYQRIENLDKSPP